MQTHAYLPTCYYYKYYNPSPSPNPNRTSSASASVTTEPQVRNLSSFKHTHLSFSLLTTLLETKKNRNQFELFTQLLTLAASRTLIPFIFQLIQSQQGFLISEF
ncbi:hypothetical protein RIF29_18429 [Crotalaria pallida]|uniref:Uncharacterized protein n=1 Tax=Crotalaria pallida TaxID=3830 RepID=A0AAN9FSN0_CROPI